MAGRGRRGSSPAGTPAGRRAAVLPLMVPDESDTVLASVVQRFGARGMPLRIPANRFLAGVDTLGQAVDYRDVMVFLILAEPRHIVTQGPVIFQSHLCGIDTQGFGDASIYLGDCIAILVLFAAAGGSAVAV